MVIGSLLVGLDDVIKAEFVRRKDHLLKWSLLAEETPFSHHRGYHWVRTDMSKANIALAIGKHPPPPHTHIKPHWHTHTGMH